MLDVELDTTGWVFRRGHRIRVSVANADWPNVWPTPEPARSEVLRGTVAPSHVVLPLVPSTSSATAPTYRPSPVVVARHADATEPPTWRVSRDMLSGRAEVEIAIEADVRVNDTTLVRRSFAGTMRVDRYDPARASAFGRHRARIVRPSGTTTSTSDLTIQATAERFHLTVTVEVLQNDSPVFVRRWIESVPRMLL